MRRPYTRSLDPQDYEFLSHAPKLVEFEHLMSAPHVLWHPHKIWENASIMQQLDELNVPKAARMIDIGSGGTFFPFYLAVEGGYANVAITDAADLASYVDVQRESYGVAVPFYRLDARDMSTLQTESYDVVMCVSTIEHVKASGHNEALREMWRLTKPGGLLFITSDYFRSDADGYADAQQRAASPYVKGQKTAYCKEFVLNLPNVIAADFVGDTDLDYRGDFVHNYSFVNICLRKHG
jgi:SAM-dependent methyltransferase